MGRLGAGRSHRDLNVLFFRVSSATQSQTCPAGGRRGGVIPDPKDERARRGRRDGEPEEKEERGRRKRMGAVGGVGGNREHLIAWSEHDN